MNRWAGRNPEAAQRLSAVRTALAETSERVGTPVENLLQPDLLRQICWDGVAEPITAEAIDERLALGGARPWQRELCTPLLLAAFTAPPEDESSSEA